jgi:hypothetical protein
MMPGEPESRNTAGAEDVRLSPNGDGRSAPLPVSSVSAVVPTSTYRWYHKAGAMVLTMFCMAIGIYLLIYPWTDSWNHNYFAAAVPDWHGYWDNLYLRGAVSGLGIVNFYISLVEAIRLRRFARQ